LRPLGASQEYLNDIGRAFADAIYTAIYSKLINQPFGIIGPRTVGQELALTTAIHSNHWCQCRLWCEMNDGVASWHEKSDFGRWVLGHEFAVVDDVLTTGKAILATKKLIEEFGGSVSCVAVAVDRSDGAITAEGLGVERIFSLEKVSMETFKPDDCPLCDSRIPMRPLPGHGWEWLQDHPDYPVAIA
jgi:orotate phosphoribosyltransferase